MNEDDVNKKLDEVIDEFTLKGFSRREMREIGARYFSDKLCDCCGGYFDE
jgi:hypothetical protein